MEEIGEEGLAVQMWEEEEEKLTWVGWVQTFEFWHQKDLGLKPSSTISQEIFNLFNLSSCV